IGGEDSLQALFKEDRGNSYFVGEVFAVHRDLVPNSQRDYFNENTVRAEFERELRKYFNEELHKIYHDGSTINSAYKKIDSYEKKEAEFKEKETAGDFVDGEHRARESQAVLAAKEEAENAQVKIERMKDKADDLLQEVIQRIEVERPKRTVKTDSRGGDKTSRRTDRLSQYSKNERKLISKIFSIIFAVADGETAERIVSKIEEGLQ
ncbi:MAG: ATP-binding protein, partial [Bacteroidetes bacterium]|nr:ATP-binding protein [Bacteroidota bacterium]